MKEKETTNNKIYTCRKGTILHIKSPKYHDSVVSASTDGGMQTRSTKKSATARLTMNIFTIVLI
jgi:hypothetical protein